jgi:uncharacterized membrane protein
MVHLRLVVPTADAERVLLELERFAGRGQPGASPGLVQRRLELARRSATALVVGFPVAIAITIVAVLILRAAGPAPDAIAAQGRPATFLIAHPDTFSVLVALLASVAGLLSLTTAKSGALRAS